MLVESIRRLSAPVVFPGGAVARLESGRA